MFWPMPRDEDPGPIACPTCGGEADWEGRAWVCIECGEHTQCG